MARLSRIFHTPARVVVVSVMILSDFFLYYISEMLKFLDQESKKIFMVLKKDIFVRVGETFTVIFT